MVETVAKRLVASFGRSAIICGSQHASLPIGLRAQPAVENGPEKRIFGFACSLDWRADPLPTPPGAISAPLP